MTNNYPLQYLAALVMKKNELNRKRRRFYHLIRRPTKLVKLANGEYVQLRMKRHKSYPNKFVALAGYNKACAEMRAMTNHMAEVAAQAGAKLVWNSSWAIKSIQVGETLHHAYYDWTGRVHRNNALTIKQLADLYYAETILLGEEEKACA